MDKRIALLKLLQVPQLGAQKIGRLLAEMDFVQFCHYDKQQLRQIGWNDRQIKRWLQPEMKWIDVAMEWSEQSQNQLIGLFDESYPFLLRQISTPPPILFVKGDVNALSLPQIAIVGSRECSAYGEYWAGYFSAELVKHQLAITSGLAIGIDGCCHQRAVAEKGVTLAVLGSGLNQLYPNRHKKLANEIIDNGGALISEFFPNQPPVAEHFPRRNRIISGLSLGTLVIEATLHSGSLITARYALEQGREVFALPNEVQNPYSQGCHKIIKEGALLVESVDDILDAIALQHQNIQPKQITLFSNRLEAKQAVRLSKSFVKKERSNELNIQQRQIVEQMTYQPINTDELAKVCQMNVDKLLVELLHLELVGAIRQVTGGYVRG